MIIILVTTSCTGQNLTPFLTSFMASKYSAENSRLKIKLIVFLKKDFESIRFTVYSFIYSIHI